MVGMSSIGRQTSRHTVGPVLLIIVAVLGNILLITNPGYFSHDEYDRERSLRMLGLRAYLTHAFRQNPDASFAVPWRPLGFAAQAVHSNFFDQPQIVHGISVTIHLISALSLYYVLKRCANSDVALLASSIFLIHPSTSHAVGWAAATHDLLWVLFAIWSLYFGLQSIFCAKVPSLSRILTSSLMYAAALMSKETAIVVPIAFFLFGFRGCRFKIHPKNNVFLGPFFAYLGVSAIYLLFRWPNIRKSLSGSDSTYTIGLETVSQNLLVYFAYPFSLSVTEVGNAIFMSNRELVVAISFHATVFIALGVVYGFSKAFLYPSLYVVTLLPLLFLGFQASHYLYASAVLSSISIALILVQSTRRSVALSLFPIVVVAVLIIHSVLNQVSIRNDGVCMQSLDSAVNVLEDAGEILIRQSESGLYSWVANRYVVNRVGLTVVGHESVVDEVTLDIEALCKI